MPACSIEKEIAQEEWKMAVVDYAESKCNFTGEPIEAIIQTLFVAVNLILIVLTLLLKFFLVII